MPSRAASPPGSPQRRGVVVVTSLLVLILSWVTAGCGVLELGDAPHEAVALEPAAPTEDGRWKLVVELLQTDIAGEAVVSVAFDGDEVSCVDGGSLPTSELAPPAELRFEQAREGVEPATSEDEPVVVSGVGVEVHCE